MKSFHAQIFIITEATSEADVMAKIDLALKPLDLNYEIKDLEDCTDEIKHAGCFNIGNCEDSYCGPKR